jgi:hypothetical protein
MNTPGVFGVLGAPTTGSLALTRWACCAWGEAGVFCVLRVSGVGSRSEHTRCVCVSGVGSADSWITGAHQVCWLKGGMFLSP